MNFMVTAMGSRSNPLSQVRLLEERPGEALPGRRLLCFRLNHACRGEKAAEVQHPSVLLCGGSAPQECVPSSLCHMAWRVDNPIDTCQLACLSWEGLGWV